MENSHKSQFGKMFMELIHRHRERTSELSSKLSGKSAKETIAFLDMRKKVVGNDGLTPAASWEIIPLSLGEDLMLNFGEFPKDASVCSLSSILEDNVPDGYFLSEKACRGILRRSEERGKPLDPLLKQALLDTIAFSQLKTTLKTAECPSVLITSSKPSQDEWVQGGGNVPLVLVPCYGQTSYDEYELVDQAVTLKASGGNYGGGKRDVDTAIGVDFYNQTLTGGQTMTLSAARSDPHHVPCTLIPYTLKIRAGCAGG